MLRIFVYNNHAGIVKDALLLKKLISNNTNINVEITYTNNIFAPEEYTTYVNDTAIWIQNPVFDALCYFEKNIWFINEEWCNHFDLSQLFKFEWVVCKNKYSEPALKTYTKKNNIVYLPFISENKYNESVVNKKNEFLHIKGKSMQKNTECLLKLNTTKKITIIDSTSDKYHLPSNFTRIKTYLLEPDFNLLLNAYNIHICPSLYEGWGHYLFEGLSTGAEIICSDIPPFNEILDPNLVHFIPTSTSDVFNYSFINNDKIFPLRKFFFINKEILKDTIENFQPKGSADQRRKLFKDIMNKNKSILLNFIKNIV